MWNIYVIVSKWPVGGLHLEREKKTGGEKNDLGPGQQADGASPFAPLKKKKNNIMLVKMLFWSLSLTYF